ncbi:MAG: metallophosphoesterase [Myxococcota bacterium]
MHLFPVFLLVMNALALLALRGALPVLRTRAFVAGYVVATLLSVFPWAALAFGGWDALEMYGAATSLVWSISIAWNVSVTLLVFSWPVWRLLVAAASRGAAHLQPDEDRRRVLRRAGLLVPMGGLAFGTSGVAAAGFRPFVRRLTLQWPDLPEGLDGFKVGQFSDVHVGPFVSPAQVAAGIQALNDEKVDVVVMTGDLHDDNAFMPAINEAFRLVTAPHGLIGILGNHEYYAGVREYLDHVRQGPMRLLVDDAMVLERNGARLHLSGVDYPFQGLDGPAEAASRSVAKALQSAQPGDFKLCLAHHPTCWDEARRHGVHLTLSGHTHGGQVAVGGRSVFRDVFKYMLGLYEDGPQRLFVTGGLGHWFPFRLGCPPEVVVIELKRGTTSA